MDWDNSFMEEDLQLRFAFYTYMDEPDVLYLSNLYIEPSSRHKGLGGKILDAAEKTAEAMNMKKLRLKTLHTSYAADWYHRNGYVIFGKEGEYDWMEKKINL